MRTLKTISEYNVLKKLGTGPWSEVFKVCRKDKPDRPLILKRIKLGRFGSRNPTNDIERQIKYLKQKSLPGTIIPDLHSHGETTLFLVQEYFKGIPLGYWRKTQTKNNLRDFFKIACAIAEILDKIHKAGHIHGGIKPNNILIMPDTLDIRLIDPVRVIKMDEIMYFIDNSDFMINTLAYLSPEQTGRIKKNLAYATDLYSIGAVFYELLNGKPPFLSTDPLEIIHSHLAEDPTPLNEIDSDIPGVVSDIIARLLRKETERRYQSGIGLLGDLVECRREYINRGKITSFSLGLRDSNVPLNIPSVMVGREREKELLLKEHTISTSGPFRAVIISGPPGIGKTRLIRELQEPIIEKGCYFTSGKPDQFHKNIPYRTLTQALRSLIRTILTEDKEKIAYWKDTITKGLGLNGRLITEFIPELELIIGIQPEVVDLPPIEARNRFINTTDRFISCMAGHDHPLTLFIDDLQWCDTTEYDAIENLFINTEDHPYLFFVGTYRQNEVVENHPLSNLLQRVRKTGNLLTELHLEKLDFFHINELTSHILNAPSSLTKSLSEIINVISGGNPLYIDESIIWLYENKLIRTNQEGLWQWDSDSIRNSMLPESAVTFFRDNLMKLPKDVVFLIQTAACLGVTFRSEDLAIITGMDIATLNQELSPAFSQKILLREKNFLAFFHDRIREAVYDTIDDKTKRRIHGRIGEMLLRSLPRGTDPMCADNLFDIVGHLNKGRDNITNRETLLRDMRLNYYAGMRSINSLAFEAASRYFKKSMEFLQENIWDTDYDFTYSLYKNLSKSELSQGNQDKSAIILETLIKKSRTEVDMAECIKERAAILLSLGEFQSSLDEGNKALSLLGVGIPRTDEDVQLKIKEYDDAIMKKPVSPDKILDRPGIYKREHLIELDIYNLQLTAYYIMLNIERFTLAAIQATYLCLTEGINEYSSFPISMYSAFLFEVVERDIPLWVKNTFNPTFPGTRIANEPEGA
ncbi:MAG: AAA family ATPase, partial [Thermodesulfobacteriota bacterium]|nr:AAA family ATPase [Thermodesulfobacteriota bacterium]